jgi:hypothetical protein
MDAYFRSLSANEMGGMIAVIAVVATVFLGVSDYLYERRRTRVGWALVAISTLACLAAALFMFYVAAIMRDSGMRGYKLSWGSPLIVSAFLLWYSARSMWKSWGDR